MTFTGSFIEIMKKYPGIYDSTHDDYRNVRKKEKIWEQIGAEVKQNGEEVKKKWKNLRDTYAKYIKGTTGLAQPTSKKWQWADQMEAFLPYLTYGKSSSSVSDITIETFKTEDDPLQLPQDDLSGNAYYDEEPENDNSSQTLNATKPPTLTLSPTVKSTPIGNTSRKRKLRSVDDSQLTSSVEESLISYIQNKQTPAMDPIDLLFLAHANTVKTFSGKRQAITKMKIAQVIMEEEILHHEEQLATQHHIEVYTT